MFYQEVPLDREINFVSKLGELTEHELHCHHALELSVVLENDAKYRLADREYYGRAGDVFVFRPFEPHWNLARDSGKPVKWIMVLFSPSVVRSIPEGYRLLTPFYTADSFSPLIAAETDYAGTIQRAARLAVAEQEQRLPGWQAKQMMCLIDILVSIYRYSSDELRSKGIPHSGGASIVPVIEHMLASFADDIDMNEMVVRSGMGRTAFFQSFRQLTSVTPNEFVNRLRLQSAIHLLDYTDKPVTEIAFECGFHSLSYFNKQFKRLRGVSPREYRNREI